MVVGPLRGPVPARLRQQKVGCGVGLVLPGGRRDELRDDPVHVGAAGTEGPGEGIGGKWTSGFPNDWRQGTRSQGRREPTWPERNKVVWWGIGGESLPGRWRGGTYLLTYPWGGVTFTFQGSHFQPQESRGGEGVGQWPEWPFSGKVINLNYPLTEPGPGKTSDLGS